MTDTDHRVSGAIHARGDSGRDDAWAVLLPPGRYDAERLVHHDTLELTGLEPPIGAAVAGPRPGDRVAVLVEEPLRLVALGRVARPTAERREDPDDPQSDPAPGALVVTYIRRAFDDPVPAEGLALQGPVSALPADAYGELAERLGPPPERRSWLVSVDIPVEAATRAEAVRLFWSYVRDLGPRELPAFVWPAGDELAMQAYVLGAEANQDPEEEDD
ncbi:hypothetical protein ACFY2R_14810 [Micromonospora olivasterospora]|uniref:Uncharacterized protein n=1 Tax=Micromonospora olivasterospora TaxID=1880 RepID=A0A562IC43_MICOL|nr:hypothetical protein [Micromonospora olivasterospora]TWH68194.1 hypothetical protein JD77_03184 [Micromonospora olivasterospora]